MRHRLLTGLLVGILWGALGLAKAQLNTFTQLEKAWARFQQGDDNEKNYRMASLLGDIEEVMHCQIKDSIPERFLAGWNVAHAPDEAFRFFYCLVPGEVQPARLLYCYIHPGQGDVFVFSQPLKKAKYPDPLKVSVQPHRKEGTGYSLIFQSGGVKLLEIPDVSVKIISERLSRTRDDILKKEATDSLLRAVERLMQLDQWYDNSFMGFDKLSTTSSSDGVLKLVTWNLEDRFGNHSFYGVAGIKQKGLIKVFSLKDSRDQIRSPEFATLTPDKWFGAIYYKVITTRHKGNTFYTLLGFNGHDAFSRLRVVDVITLSSNGTPRFGASLFEMSGRVRRRLIFEYSNQATMMLRYDESFKRIVMDHLEALDPMYQGNRNYYGPDLSVDALVLKKGRWILREDVDFRNR